MNPEEFVKELRIKGATDEEIAEILQARSQAGEFDSDIEPSAIQPQNMQEISTPIEKAYQNRISNIENIAQLGAQGKISNPSQWFQAMPQYAAIPSDIAFAGLEQAYGSIPKNIRKPYETIGKYIGNLVTETPAIKGAKTLAGLVAPYAKNATGLALKKYGELKENYPEIVGDIEAVPAYLQAVLPEEYLRKLAGKGFVGFMEGVARAGTLSNLKMPKQAIKTAYGKNIIEQKNNVINTLKDYGITHGTNEGKVHHASGLIDQLETEANNIARKMSEGKNAQKFIPSDIAFKNIDDVFKTINEEDIPEANKILENLKESYNKPQYNNDVTAEGLIRFKQRLNSDGDIFKQSLEPKKEESIKNKFKRKMFFNTTDAISEISPEIKAINTESKKLYDARAALTHAASREMNNNPMSITDWGVLGNAVSNPGGLAVSLPTLAVKGALKKERLGNIGFNVSRYLKGDKPKTLDDILKNVSGNKRDLFEDKINLPENYELPAHERYGTIYSPELERGMTNRELQLLKLKSISENPQYLEAAKINQMQPNMTPEMYNTITRTLNPLPSNLIDIVEGRPVNYSRATNVSDVLSNMTPETIKNINSIYNPIPENIKDLISGNYTGQNIPRTQEEVKRLVDIINALKQREELKKAAYLGTK